MSTQHLSVTRPAGPEAEPPVLSLALTCGPITVIELSGDVDMSTAHLITELVTRVSEKHPSQVILDMTDVSFFGAAGITALLHARRTTKDSGGELLLRHPSRITMRILTTTGAAAIFPIDGHGVRRTESVI
jgi:anti-sigma B factor antagonist